MEEKQAALHRMILSSEGPRLEFKERFTTAIDREVVALANTGGGEILIGVADSTTRRARSEELRALSFEAEYTRYLSGASTISPQRIDDLSYNIARRKE